MTERKNGKMQGFFHGTGHGVGLQIHEEPRVSRGGQPLPVNAVVTVEPGLYLIGALADMWRAEDKHFAFINYDEFEQWRDFGGIRIEDDIVVTEDGCRVLGPGIPKQPGEVEAVVQSGAETLAVA